MQRVCAVRSTWVHVLLRACCPQRCHPTPRFAPLLGVRLHSRGKAQRQRRRLGGLLLATPSGQQAPTLTGHSLPGWLAMPALAAPPFAAAPVAARGTAAAPALAAVVVRLAPIPALAAAPSLVADGSTAVPAAAARTAAVVHPLAPIPDLAPAVPALAAHTAVAVAPPAPTAAPVPAIVAWAGGPLAAWAAWACSGGWKTTGLGRCKVGQSWQHRPHILRQQTLGVPLHGPAWAAWAPAWVAWAPAWAAWTPWGLESVLLVHGLHGLCVLWWEEGNHQG